MTANKRYLDPATVSAGIGIVSNLIRKNNPPPPPPPKPDYTPILVGIGILVAGMILIVTLK